MTQTLHSRVLETIERHSMIVPGDRVGIGVSGGADSVALLRLFAELQSQLGAGLLVLHFHHQLRGAEADEDEAFVASLARQLGLEFVADRADVAAEAKRNGWNLEDAARRLRYRFFDSTAVARGLNRVAVAHTGDDQAETVLAHVLRGTGPAGLAGIYPVAGLVIRPLLDVRRDELRGYLNGLRQPWREDVTNQDTSRTRARIRHKLLPLLERDFAPAVVERLGRLAGLAREEEVFWHAFEQERFAALVSLETSSGSSGHVSVGVSVDVADLLAPFPPLAPNHSREAAPTTRAADTQIAEKLGSLVGRAFRHDKRAVLPSGVLTPDGLKSSFPPACIPNLALTRRLVRRIYFELRGSRQQLTARHVEDVVHLAAKGHSGSRLELAGVIVERVFDRLVFSRISTASRSDRSRPAPAFEYTIPQPEASGPVSIAIPEIGRRFNLKIVDWSARARETIVEQSTLDFDRLRWPLVLRNWHAGDSYRPYQRHRVRKLKRMLLESRVPLSDRASWPVLTSAGALVWALRFPVADEFAPKPGTRAGLVIAEEKF